MIRISWLIFITQTFLIIDNDLKTLKVKKEFVLT